MENQVFNPYLPSYEYVPDGEPRIFGDRLYVFGSHDRFNGKGFCMNDYVCWTAPLSDISKWRNEGVIYRKDQDVHSGGSGCGCSAAGLAAYLYDEFAKKRVKNAMFIGTGALMSPMALAQGQSIPGIAHLLRFSAGFECP